MLHGFSPFYQYNVFDELYIYAIKLLYIYIYYYNYYYILALGKQTKRILDE